MLCACHGEPCYWQKDKRGKDGGYWECAIRRKEHNAKRYTDPSRQERVRQQKRDRYDTDPVFRIGTNLRKQRRRRVQTIERLREGLRG